MTVHPGTFKMEIAIVVSEPCICFLESTEVVLAGYMHNVTERLARLVYKNDCYDIADRHVLLQWRRTLHLHHYYNVINEKNHYANIKTDQSKKSWERIRRLCTRI